MRLTPAKVDDLVCRVVEALRSSEDATLADDNRASGVARDTLLDDLRGEDQLDEEVRALLKRHASQIHGENLDYNLLFQKAKRQMAREKGIVL